MANGDMLACLGDAGTSHSRDDALDAFEERRAALEIGARWCHACRRLMREKGWLALAVNKQLLEMLEYAHGLMQEHADLAGQRMSLTRLYAQVEQDAKEPNRNAKLLRWFSPWEQQDKEWKDEE